MTPITKYVVVSPMKGGQLYEHTRCDTMEVARQEAHELTHDSYGDDPSEAVALIYRVTQELVETVTATFAAEVAA